MKDADYSFHPQLVVRTPRLPLDTDFTEDRIKDLLQQSWFREAIYIASPELYDECIRFLQGELKEEKKQKLIVSLAKYYARMNSRCTPFGIFAGCSVVQWGEQTKITMKEMPARRTRLDMFYLSRLVQELSKKDFIRDRLRYSANNTGYVVGDEWRYIEVRYANNQRAYRISAVGYSEYLKDILLFAGTGVTIRQLTDHLQQYSATEAEALIFVNELIEEQVLVSEWEVAITGKEYMYQVLGVLEKINTDGDWRINLVMAVLYYVESTLKRIDKEGVNDVNEYKNIIERLKQLEVPFEENRIFQADAVQATEPGGMVSESVQQTLKEGIDFLKALTPDYLNDNLEQFKKRFREKYEGREMPLALVLDTESGIGYKREMLEQHESPLIHGLVLPAGGAVEPPSIGGYESRWLKYLLKAQKENAHTIVLTDDDIGKPSADRSDWPPSFIVSFKLAADGKVVIDYAGGSSAVNLLGRFGYADPGLADLGREVTGREEKQNPDVILAEIVHLPEDRTGNVLQHPAFRSYEIPYLAKAGVDAEHSIGIDDLLVSVVNDRVVLRSARLGKEIIPRLSNAHNYSYHSLPIYHFLCDLQMQGQCSGASFNFGGLESYFNFLPRVEYKQCILYPATWVLGRRDFEGLAFDELVSKWNLPKRFVLADGDNELLIDCTNELMRSCFINLLKKRPGIRLKEFIEGDGEAITGAGDRPYMAQFIGLLVNERVSYQSGLVKRDEPVQKLQRSFIPGSEWLYVKLYCGFKTADRLLLEVVYRVVAECKREGLIQQWFFIRYGDPQFHLRVRFMLKEAAAGGIVLQLLQEAVKPFMEDGLVSKVQTDTYEREVERYGESTMEWSEFMFFADSLSIIELLQAADEENIETFRWLWAMCVANDLLQHAGFTEKERLEFAQRRREQYGREFHTDADFKLQLDKKYRQYRGLAEGFLQGGLKDEAYNEVKDICDARQKVLMPVLLTAIEILQNDGRVSLESFLASHIHMMLNRVFMANERLHELVVYDFLVRYYQSNIARKLKPEKDR